MLKNNVDKIFCRSALLKVFSTGIFPLFFLKNELPFFFLLSKRSDLSSNEEKSLETILNFLSNGSKANIGDVPLIVKTL
jgi:hypothetical protein